MEETEKLNRQLDEMRDKSKQLNESLKALAAEGFDRLAQAVPRPASRAAKQDEGAIVTQELARLLRQEMAAGIAAVFAGPQKSGGMSVIINNNAGVSVAAREGFDGFDRKMLEITIDQMVASALTRGQETTGILRSIFNLVPTLTGR